MKRALALSVAIGVFAPAAHAEVRSGSVDDGISFGVGHADIDKVAVAYDTGGGLEANVKMVDSDPLFQPDGPTPLIVVAGTVAAGTSECGFPRAYLDVVLDRPVGPATWSREDSPTSIEGSGSATFTERVDNSFSLAASSPALAGRPYDCAFALADENGGSIYDDDPDTTEVFRLAAPSPAPPGGGTPGTARPTFKLSSSHSRIKGRNRGFTLKVRVKNTSGVRAGAVKVKLGKARGLTIRPRSRARTIALINPGQTRTATFRLKLGSRARRSTSAAIVISGVGINRLKLRTALVLPG